MIRLKKSWWSKNWWKRKFPKLANKRKKNKQKENRENEEDKESVTDNNESIPVAEKKNLWKRELRKLANKRKKNKQKENRENEEDKEDKESVKDNNESIPVAENSKRKSKNKQKGKQKSVENNEGNSQRNSMIIEVESNVSLRDDKNKQPNVNTLRDDRNKQPNGVTLRDNKNKQFLDPKRRYSDYQILIDIRERKNHAIQKLKNKIESLNEKVARLRDECFDKERRIKELEPFKESYQLLQKALETKNKILHNNIKLEDAIKEKDKRIEELDITNGKQSELILDLHTQIDELKNETQNLIKERDKHVEDLKKVENETQRDKQLELLKRLETPTESEDLQESIKKYKIEINQLKIKNKSLMEENSEHQNYIGKAISFSLSDDDKNHSVQLVKDIESLQTMIMDYVGNLRPRVDVNLEEVDKLSIKYGCNTRITSKENNALIKAIIQRHVFEKVLEEAENYFKVEKDNDCSENRVYGGTKCLLGILSEFSATRDGTNEIIQALPIKIRQQIYGLLGNLGFADVIEVENGKKKHEHHFITSMKDTLNKSVNNLRTIKDQKKKKKHDDMVVNLIRELIRIFWYRLNVQEPIAKYYWFSYNDKIDANLMKGKWENDENDENDDNDESDDNDEDNNDLFVEICAFPLIVANYKEKDQKIYTHAKVNHQVNRTNGCV